MSNLAKLVFVLVLIVGPDIRRAFTGPLVIWFSAVFDQILVKMVSPLFLGCLSKLFMLAGNENMN